MFEGLRVRYKSFQCHISAAGILERAASHAFSFVLVLSLKLVSNGSIKSVFLVCHKKVKGSLQLFRSILRATQLIRIARLIPCATQSHSSSLSFAMAKATQFQFKVKSKHLTITSRPQPSAAGTVARWRVRQPLL